MSIGLHTLQPSGNGRITELLLQNAASPPAAGDRHDADGTLPIFTNFTESMARGRADCHGDAITEIAARLFQLTGGFPKRIGGQLISVTADYCVQFLDSPHRLFAWIGERAKVIWATGPDMVPRDDFVAHLQLTAEEFEAVESLPHWPPLPRIFYAHRPLPPATGRRFDELLQRFCPASSVDGQLLEAFFLSLFWGGRPGTRPAWLFTGEFSGHNQSLGIGKSKVTEIAGLLTGGLIEVSPTEDIGRIKTRLLSPDAQQLRIARLDNVKAHRFSWADLEALITSPVVSGHRLYQGEGCRPNILTWVLTLNGASLSADMAQRVIVVKLARPGYSPDWEADVMHFVESNRWQIVSDIIGRLKN